MHMQQTRNNDLVGPVFSLHHLSDHRLYCRAFPVTKEISRTRLNISMSVSVGSSSTVMGYVFQILELQFIVLKLPSSTCHFNFQHVNECAFFPSQFLNCACQFTCIFFCASFCVSKVKNLQKLCQTYTLSVIDVNRDGQRECPRVVALKYFHDQVVLHSLFIQSLILLIKF